MTSAPLFERDEALQALSSAVTGAVDGTGAGVMIVGPAGTGKTTLVARAVGMAGSEMRVVRAQGTPTESELAFAYVEQLVGDPHLLRAATSESGERRPAVYEAVRSTVVEWARAGPVLVCLDDLQWADPDSLAALGFLARRLSNLPVALVAAMRPWPDGGRSLAVSLAQGKQATYLELLPLSRSATEALLRELVSIPGPDEAPAGLEESELFERAWRLTRGNPMLVHQAALTVSEARELPESAGAAGADLARLQRTLLLSHLAGLSLPALECARAAAVLGTRSRIRVIEHLVDMKGALFAEAFDSLVASGVLRDAGGGWAEFSHDLLAAAIYDDMGPGRRRELHVRAFAYHATRGDVAAGASHALAADLAGDEQAISLVSDGGDRAIAEGAIGTGVALLEAAVRLAGPAASQGLLARLGDAQFAADRPGAALSIYRHLLGTRQTARSRIDTLAKAARAQAYSGDLDQAILWFDQALAEAEGLSVAEADEVLGGLLATRAHLAWERDGPLAGLEVLDPSRSDRRWPSPEAPILGALRGFFRLKNGDRAGAAAVEAAAQAARQRISADRSADRGDLVASFNILLIHPAACVALERLDEAAELVTYARQRFREAGSVRSTVALATASVLTLLNQGELVQAVSEANAFEEEIGSDLLGRPRLALLKAQALTWMGRFDESRAICDEVEAEGGVSSQFAQLSLGVARAQHLWARGRGNEASRAYLDLEDLAHLVGIGSMLVPLWTAGAIDAAVGAGAHQRVERIAAWLDERNASLGCTWPRMLALAARAGIGAAQGDPCAGALYEEALVASGFLPLQRAVISVRYGAWLRHGGDIGRARAVLADAVAVAQRAGASLLEARAHSELTAAGGRRRRTRDTSELSTQEARVAALAATGASTREIAESLYLSPRTVESHLGRVFAKLGVASRRELRQRRLELGL